MEGALLARLSAAAIFQRRIQSKLAEVAPASLLLPKTEVMAKLECLLQFTLIYLATEITLPL